MPMAMWSSILKIFCLSLKQQQMAEMAEMAQFFVEKRFKTFLVRYSETT
jgi:hypothetical protein